MKLPSDLELEAVVVCEHAELRGRRSHRCVQIRPELRDHFSAVINWAKVKYQLNGAVVDRDVGARWKVVQAVGLKYIKTAMGSMWLICLPGRSCRGTAAAPQSHRAR